MVLVRFTYVFSQLIKALNKLLKCNILLSKYLSRILFIPQFFLNFKKFLVNVIALPWKNQSYRCLIYEIDISFFKKKYNIEMLTQNSSEKEVLKSFCESFYYLTLTCESYLIRVFFILNKVKIYSRIAFWQVKSYIVL